MAQVNTVLGPVDTENLGVTLVHEHLVWGPAGWDKDSRYTFDYKTELEKAVQRLTELKQYGVQTFVDPCCIETGRNPEYAAEVSERTGVHVIYATGVYTEEMGMPGHFRRMDVDDLADLFVRDLTEGMAGTGIKAGIIKCATSAPITEHEEKALRAAARAAKATNTRIITHTSGGGTYGDRQVEVFLEEGLPPHHFAIGHSDDNANLKYHDSLLQQGCYVSFDRFGLEFTQPDRLRIAALAGLLAIGWGNRLLLSHDSVACFLGRRFEPPPDFASRIANWHPSHIFKNILPALKAAGVSQQTIDGLIRDNPRRYFEGSPN